MQPGLLDTAACDGPVKFHRVVNKYFTVSEDMATEGVQDTETAGQKEAEESEEGDTPPGDGDGS